MGGVRGRAPRQHLVQHPGVRGWGPRGRGEPVGDLPLHLPAPQQPRLPVNTATTTTSNIFQQPSYQDIYNITCYVKLYTHLSPLIQGITKLSIGPENIYLYQTK